MSYDLDIIKVKRNKLNNLLKSTNLSLENAYSYGYITFKQEEYEYHESVIFLQEEDTVWTNSSLLLGFLLSKGISSDDVKIVSVDFLNEIKEHLENYLKVTIFEILEDLDEFDISKAFVLYKQLVSFINNIEKDDVIIVTHSW